MDSENPPDKSQGRQLNKGCDSLGMKSHVSVAMFEAMLKKHP